MNRRFEQHGSTTRASENRVANDSAKGSNTESQPNRQFSHLLDQTGILRRRQHFGHHPVRIGLFGTVSS